MKRIFEYKEFISDKMNEGFFDWLKNLFKKQQALFNKTKGGKELEVIYQKYQDKIRQEIEKTTGKKFPLGAKTDAVAAGKKESEANVAVDVKGKPVEAEKQNAGKTYLFKYNDFVLNEQEADIPTAAAQKVEKEGGGNEPKMDGKELKKLEPKMITILNKYKELALKEMDAVLTKYGGAAENAPLKALIDIKKMQFELDFMIAQKDVLPEDDPIAKKLEKDIPLKEKEINNLVDKAGKGGASEIEVAGKKFKIGSKEEPFYYRFGEEGKRKPMKVIGKGDEENKIQASYIFGDTKDEPQNFDPNKVELDFKPDPEKEYWYCNNDGKFLKVKPTSDKVDPKTGNVEVALGDEKFKIKAGRLSDLNDEGKTIEEAGKE